MKRVGIVTLSLGLLIFPTFVFAAFYSFGGHILRITLCDEGILFYVGPPKPGVFIRTPISVFFPTVILPSWLTLGVAATVPIPCTVGIVPTGEAGLPVIFGGTSLSPGL